MFEVLSPGIQTSVQDTGRIGVSHLGIRSLGAMDEYAYKWCQRLLDNQNQNALEILLTGLKLKATKPTTLAVCGAALGFKINGKSKPIWHTHMIHAGDILVFRKRVSGMRAYLTVKEGFETPKQYGSYSQEIALKKGDTLPYTSHVVHETRRVMAEAIPTYTDTLTLRLFLTYQSDYFTKEQKEQFFNTTYEITPEISRMGYKLKGDPMIPSKSGIISEGIAFGSVQIPKDGQPIILLKDRQTIGGYPKIGVVVAEDFYKLAQMPIGGKIRFKEVNI